LITTGFVKEPVKWHSVTLAGSLGSPRRPASRADGQSTTGGGVGVIVGVGVFVGVLVGVFVGVFVGVLVGVFVGVFVGVLVGVLVGVAVGGIRVQVVAATSWP